MRDYSGYYGENAQETPEDVLIELMARFGQSILRAEENLQK